MFFLLSIPSSPTTHTLAAATKLPNANSTLQAGCMKLYSTGIFLSLQKYSHSLSSFLSPLFPPFLSLFSLSLIIEISGTGGEPGRTQRASPSCQSLLSGSSPDLGFLSLSSHPSLHFCPPPPFCHTAEKELTSRESLLLRFPVGSRSLGVAVRPCMSVHMFLRALGLGPVWPAGLWRRGAGWLE